MAELSGWQGIAAAGLIGMAVCSAFRDCRLRPRSVRRRAERPHATVGPAAAWRYV